MARHLTMFSGRHVTLACAGALSLVAQQRVADLSLSQVAERTLSVQQATHGPVRCAQQVLPVLCRDDPEQHRSCSLSVLGSGADGGHDT